MNTLSKSMGPFSGKKEVIQPKLSINRPGDEYEQEADAMAEKVMSMPANGTDFTPKTGIIGASIQRKCAACEEEEKQKKIMRKETGGLGGSVVSNSFSSTLNSTKGGGTTLPQSTRGFMENAFSTDFTNVRIHNDSQANQMSQSINAKAFTHGNDIYFGAGQYAPNTYSGKSLLAHELTHTVQQNGQSIPKIQRKMNDGHDLKSPRFAGDLVLEECFDDNIYLSIGSTGVAVEKIQQALTEAGFPLKNYGIDGIFGPETEAAVREYQKSKTILIDGIVGPQTMGELDTQFIAAPIPAPSPTPVSTITYTKPSEIREDPIPKALSTTKKLMGETLPKFNGTIVRDKNAALAILGPLFIDNITLSYDQAAKVCTVNVADIKLDVSAQVQKLTLPNPIWSGTYPGTMVRNCGQKASVKIEMDSAPSGAAGYEQRIADDEQEHVDDLNRIAHLHFDSFYQYLSNIKLSSANGQDCASLYVTEIGTKDGDMLNAFINDWLAAVAVHDSAGGNHHHKSITDNRNCNLVKITANY